MLTSSAVPWRPSSSTVSRASTSARRLGAGLGRETEGPSLSLSSGASLRPSPTGKVYESITQSTENKLATILIIG